MLALLTLLTALARRALVPGRVVSRASVSMRGADPDPIRDEAYSAGEAAARSAAAPASARGGQRASTGRKFSVTLQRRPFGLVLEMNPSGRGTFINDILPGSAAEARGDLNRGDFLVSLTSSGGRSMNCAWLPLENVTAAVQEAPIPLTLQFQRDGSEPWTQQRDGGGLSVEEMMEDARSQYGR